MPLFWIAKGSFEEVDSGPVEAGVDTMVCVRATCVVDEWALMVVWVVRVWPLLVIKTAEVEAGTTTTLALDVVTRIDVGVGVGLG